MKIVLAILLVAAMGATLYVLVRGVIAMASGKVGSSEQQQKWMQRRVFFQAIAIIFVILILLVASSANH